MVVVYRDQILATRPLEPRDREFLLVVSGLLKLHEN